MNAIFPPSLSLAAQFETVPDPARPLVLGFVTPHNPYDRTAFSGTAYHALTALRQRSNVQMRLLGPHRSRRPLDRILRRRAAPDDLGGYDLAGLDAVIGLVASPLLDRLRHRLQVPFIHVTDATPGFLRDVYGWDIPAAADATERRVARAAAAVLYSSEYMAARARTELGQGINAQAAPFGINFETLPAHCPKKEPLAPLDLLFVGLDWVRKGGDMALATLDHLRGQGVRARLTVVGRTPPGLRGHPGVTCAGYLDKNRPRDAARLAALYARAHLLLLPSRGDCTPMVVAEALIHGTPVLASETGGIATLVRAGCGTILPPAARAEDWAAAVRALTARSGQYADRSEAAFAQARKHLTWASWAARVEGFCHEALATAEAI